MSNDTTTRARAPRAIAWADGRVLPASEATVPLTDDGFLRGDAVFDTALVRRGRTHALDAHLARLRRSAKAMGIRVPVLRRTIADLLAAWGEHDGMLKLVVTRNGTVRGLVSTVSWPDSLALELIETPWATALTGIKTLSYAANQWAHRQAIAAHADDALVTERGIVLELPTAAICVVRDGRVHTPDPARHPVLDSVTVHELAGLTELVPDTIEVGDLDGVDELFVLSATRPVLAVHAVGDREFPAPGPVTEDLRVRLHAHIEATLDPLP